jgi:hypothetical protein
MLFSELSSPGCRSELPGHVSKGPDEKRKQAHSARGGNVPVFIHACMIVNRKTAVNKMCQ